MRDVGKQIAFDLAAAGSFQVHDPVHARIDLRNIVRAACLKQDGATGVRQQRHQGQDIFLQERLAAGDLDQLAIVAGNRAHDFTERFLFTLVKGVFRVAIGTAQIAKSESDENAGQPCPGAFPLHREVNLVDRQFLLPVGHRFQTYHQSGSKHQRQSQTRRAAKTSMTSALTACVPTCQAGRAKIRAPSFKAVQRTIVQVIAPETTAAASMSELRKVACP